MHRLDSNWEEKKAHTVKSIVFTPCIAISMEISHKHSAQRSKPIAERTKYQPRPSQIDMMKFSVFAFIAFTQVILHCLLRFRISLLLLFSFAFPVASSDLSIDLTKQTVAMFDDCTRSNIQSPSLRIDANTRSWDWSSSYCLRSFCMQLNTNSNSDSNANVFFVYMPNGHCMPPNSVC